MYDLHSLRHDEFPFSAELAYLNHAGISPLPQRTKHRVQWAIEMLSNNPNDFFGNHAMPAFASIQEMLGRYLNAQSTADIVISTSTSAALNAVAQAIDWRTGDNIIFCDQEFPANAYPWMSLTRDGVEARPIPTDNGGLTLRQIEAFADDRTRVVAASAIQFFSGHRTDLAAIGRFCRERDILFIVDAIQAIGHMKFDVQAMNIDVLATGGMKSLLALPGIGFIYVRESVAEAMRPRLIHGNATADYLHWLAYDMTLLPGAARLASGTPNVPGVFALGSSLELINELGPENIDTHTTGLARHTIDALTREGYQVITPVDALGPIVTFHSPVDSATTDLLIQHLAAHHIVVCKHLDAAAAPYVRVSFHCYNTAAEADRFMEGLRGFVN